MPTKKKQLCTSQYAYRAQNMAKFGWDKLQFKIYTYMDIIYLFSL